MALGRRADPFSHSDWFCEVKWDGFRSLAYIHDGKCRLISRHGNTFKSFPDLSRTIPAELGAQSAIIDGEIVCLDEHGKSQFEDLLFHRGEPRFCAFDLLWADGADLRCLPLIERKCRLAAVMPSAGSRLLYCDHIEGDGEGLFRLACENDLEGIVAKHKYAPYLPEQETTWFKIRNQSYSQWTGREELFERERGGDPDNYLWDSCTMACAASATP